MRRPIHHHRRALTGCLAVVALTAAGSACGDDDDDADATGTPATQAASPPTTAAAVPTTAASEPTEPAEPAEPTGAPGSAPAELAAFCGLAEELNNQNGPPTMEQIEEYADLAPDELSEPVGVVVDALNQAGGDFTALFTDEEAQTAFEELTAYETEQCGFEPPDEGPPQDPSVTVLDPDATRVDVEATDYHFEAEFPTDAGRYSFVMTNAGDEVHLMILVRLEEGATIDEVLASEGEEGVAEVYESDVTPPGGEGIVTTDLAPGQWVMVCPIPTPDGTPHFAEGMIHEFTIS